jgi:pantetheine-phosphate adenylyltransferase
MAERRVAVYPGSFDPIHNGHLDIIQRGRPRFDEIIIGVLENDEKKPLFSAEERVSMIREEVREWPECRVESFSGLLVHFMDTLGAKTIVRGLRAVSDFEYEFQMALMNRKLNDRVDTVFLMPNEEYIYLSSRLVKEVFFLGGNLEGLVPPRVLAALLNAAAGGGTER